MSKDLFAKKNSCAFVYKIYLIIFKNIVIHTIHVYSHHSGLITCSVYIIICASCRWKLIPTIPALQLLPLDLLSFHVLGLYSAWLIQIKPGKNQRKMGIDFFKLIGSFDRRLTNQKYTW